MNRNVSEPGWPDAPGDARKLRVRYVWGLDRVWGALRTPQAHPFSALMEVARDRSEAVVFAFRTHLPPRYQLPPLRLRGLDPDAQYEVEGLPGARSGRAWMHAGLTVALGDFASTVGRIRRVSG